MEQPEGSLHFLGFTLRYDLDLKGREWRYLNILPSKKAVVGLRDKIRELTHSGYKKPLAEVIGEVNLVLRGWSELLPTTVIPRDVSGTSTILCDVGSAVFCGTGANGGANPFAMARAFMPWLETLWVGLSVGAALPSTPCVCLEARDCRRAGCGKSARPVRRGGGGNKRHGLQAFCHDARKGRYYGSLWPKHLMPSSLLYR